ncbi:hypothetical protein ACLVWU_05745 [Bdellovibrio sp. HCB290]|uniref:hypothetical protein n=1 Tax=Bdellovibrio sp. HCB290 TaxID=3394356 RepID=UPI0039B550A2
MKRIIGLGIAITTCTVAFKFSYQPVTELSSRSPAQAPFHSATEDEMANPRCVNQDHVRRNNLKNFIAKYSDISKLELPAVSEVAGVRFENEHPELVYRFMQLVTPPADRIFASKNLKPDDIKKAFGKPNGCDKVMCAVQRLFGKEEGPLILLLLTEYDLNLSHYVWNNADAWKASEIRDIMKAIEATPGHLLPLDLNQKMIHFKRGYGYKGAEDVIANASIEVFDVWNGETQPIRQYSIYHEFAHNWSAMHANNIDVSPEWLKVSGWDSQDKNPRLVDHWKMHPGTQQVSIYAKTNPFEDFAESVSAFRYAPHRLKSVSAEKYKFVKDIVYGGMDFTGSCPRAGDFDIRHGTDFAAFDHSASKEFIDSSASKCFRENIGVLRDPRLKAGFLSCLSIRAANQVLRQDGQVHDDDNKPLALYDILGDARVRFPEIERRGTAELRELLTNILVPHLPKINEALKAKECDYAFDASKTEFQANELGLKSYDLYFAIKDLSQLSCKGLMDSKQTNANREKIFGSLKEYF